MTTRLLIVAIAVCGLLSLSAHAHHSFTAVYQTRETVTMEGTVAQFLFRNPHSVLHIVVPDESGEEVRWAVEWQGANQLGAGGVASDTLKPGDPVIVTGNPGRDPREHRVRMIRVERTTDGFSWGDAPGEVVD